MTLTVKGRTLPGVLQSPWEQEHRLQIRVTAQKGRFFQHIGVNVLGDRSPY